MGDFGIAEAAAVISALATVGSAAYGIATAPGAPKVPKPQVQDPTQLSKSLLPGAKADVAARAGGGISPEFIASLLGQQTGVPSAGLDVLSDIRRSLNVPEGA